MRVMSNESLSMVFPREEGEEDEVGWVVGLIQTPNRTSPFAVHMSTWGQPCSNTTNAFRKEKEKRKLKKRKERKDDDWPLLWLESSRQPTHRLPLTASFPSPPGQTPTHASESVHETAKVHVKSSLSRWESLQKEKHSIPSPALDKLMALAGLEMVKEKALVIYECILAEQALTVERRVPQSFNFALLGNPGTGKSNLPHTHSFIDT